MKRNYKQKLSLLLLLIPFLGISAVGPIKGKIEKSRTIKKEFTVNADAVVNIANKFGNLDVVTWSENRVVMEITIKVNGNNESKLLEQLENIDVQFSNSSSSVSAKTVINKTSSGWWFGNNSNVNYEINYKVKMPKTNSVNFENDYGSISLNELNGKANISCDYGKIIIGNLNHPDNTINIDYTSNSSIEFMNGGSINADYSGFTLAMAKQIDLNADYTSSKFENIEKLQFSCDYGSVEVKNGNHINGSGDYLTMKFGNIYKNIKVEADYGGIKIERMMKGFSSVDLKADYTGIKVGVDPEADYRFNIITSYGGLDYPQGQLEFEKKIVKNSSSSYEGYAKNQTSGSLIRIETSYGGINLYNN